MATTAQTAPSSLNWLLFAFLTVGCWGVYGILLHKGSIGMKALSASGPAEGPDVLRYKAFLFVGIAYFLVAILAPAALLLMKGASWTFPRSGLWMSLVAGIVGAVGAFGVLLAFGAGGKPVVVMSIIFAGAPVVNSLVLVFFIDKTVNQLTWPFVLGIFLAAAGGVLVTLYRPAAVHGPAKVTAAAAAPATPGADGQGGVR